MTGIRTDVDLSPGVVVRPDIPLSPDDRVALLIAGGGVQLRLAVSIEATPERAVTVWDDLYRAVKAARAEVRERAGYGAPVLPDAWARYTAAMAEPR